MLDSIKDIILKGFSTHFTKFFVFPQGYRPFFLGLRIALFVYIFWKCKGFESWVNATSSAILFGILLLFSHGMYKLLQLSIINSKRYEYLVMLFAIFIFPLILGVVIIIVDGNLKFSLRDLSKSEWATLFSGVLTYIGTTTLGILSVYKKDAKTRPKGMSITFSDTMVFRKMDMRVLAVSRIPTHSLNVLCSLPDCTYNEKDICLLSISLPFTNDGMTFIASIRLEHAEVTLYFIGDEYVPLVDFESDPMGQIIQQDCGRVVFFVCVDVENNSCERAKQLLTGIKGVSMKMVLKVKTFSGEETSVKIEAKNYQPVKYKKRVNVKMNVRLTTIDSKKRYKCRNGVVKNM